MATKQWLETHKAEMHLYRKTWYNKNKEYQKNLVIERKHILKKWMDDLKSQKECLNCGENHPATLDFHHRDRENKDIEIGLTLRQGWSKDRILTEIEKCDVLCSNCHRKLHWNEKLERARIGTLS